MLCCSPHRVLSIFDIFLFSTDLLVMCRQLNMLESVDDIVHQLGADNHKRVSFVEFARCRRGLVAEIEREQHRSMQSSLQEGSSQQGVWPGVFRFGRLRESEEWWLF